jgi:hypothetical protein
VGYFFIGKQKVVLFLKYRENSWKSAASAMREWRVRCNTQDANQTVLLSSNLLQK